MMPCDWIGMVTIRSDTLCSTSMNGTMIRSPGVRVPRTCPSRNSTPCSYCFTTRTDIAAPISSRTTTTTRTMIRASITSLNSWNDEMTRTGCLARVEQLPRLSKPSY